MGRQPSRASSGSTHISLSARAFWEKALVTMMRHLRNLASGREHTALADSLVEGTWFSVCDPEGPSLFRLFRDDLPHAERDPESFASMVVGVVMDDKETARHRREEPRYEFKEGEDAGGYPNLIRARWGHSFLDPHPDSPLLDDL